MSPVTAIQGPSHARFDAFGSYGFLAVRRPAALTAVRRIARAVVADVDATCSRFRLDSDLTRVNHHPGEWVDVDPLLVAGLEAACAAAAQTDGLVNPLLGRPMVQLGYDRDFGKLTPRDEVPLPWPPPHVDADVWRRIDRHPDGAVRIPPDTALDLGSIGKAWAADLVAAGIEQELGEPSVISLGGDIRIAAPDGGPWPVAVSERPGAPTTGTIGLTSGGLATSSTRVRRWTRNRVVRHHIVDPRTGLPAAERWRTVTASGPTCSAANTASTAAVVLGDRAMGWLRQHGVTARLVAADGTVTATSGWPIDTERPIATERTAS